MEINCISNELNEEFIKEMTILKLEKNYGFIEGEEFKEAVIALGLKYGFSDYAELLSFTAFKVIVNRIEEMQNENVRILFNETVEVPDGDDFISKTCDVILIGTDVIEVITLFSANVNVISAYDNEEIKFLGIGAIDKFLSRMECSKIRLITIQPNLDLCSIYETTIEKMLHEYDFGL